MPVSAVCRSAATMPISPRLIACRKPVTMNGIADGSSTSPHSRRSSVLNERATSSSRGSTLFTPWNELTTSGKNVNRKTATTLPCTPMPIRYGILTIGKENGEYVVCAGNLVARSDVERLRARLIKIRDMSKDELKALYKEQLRAEPEEGSKGAGLGFMEIARRASKPIEFDFADIDSTYAFFA